MNATVVTAGEKKGFVGAFMSKHVAKTGTLSIEEQESAPDMNSPSIKTTPTHVAFFVPKNMLWLVILGSVVGGPSLATYVANRAGLVTQTEMRMTVTEAVAASQKATHESLHKIVEDAVKSAVEAAVKPIDERMSRVERASKATKAAKESVNAQ